MVEHLEIVGAVSERTGGYEHRRRAVVPGHLSTAQATEPYLPVVSRLPPGGNTVFASSPVKVIISNHQDRISVRARVPAANGAVTDKDARRFYADVKLYGAAVAGSLHGSALLAISLVEATSASVYGLNAMQVLIRWSLHRSLLHLQGCGRELQGGQPVRFDAQEQVEVSPRYRREVGRLHPRYRRAPDLQHRQGQGDPQDPGSGKRSCARSTGGVAELSAHHPAARRPADRRRRRVRRARAVAL